VPLTDAEAILVSSLFRIVEVYRPSQRRGPVLVGETPTGNITIGTRLVSCVDPARQTEVLAIDMPTRKTEAEGRLAMVVSPDLGDDFRPGATFEIIGARSLIEP
jgi:hypothetical protein